MRPPRGSVVGLAAAVFVVGALVVVDEGGRRSGETFVPGSVYSDTPEGLALAYRYLGERTRVDVLSGRLGAGTLPEDGVLFRVRPLRTRFAGSVNEGEDEGEEEEAEGEEEGAESGGLLSPPEEAWVRGGGRLVLGLEDDYGPVSVSQSGRGGPVKKVFPLWPGVGHLEPGRTPRVLTVDTALPVHAVFTRGPEALVTRVALGRGDVVLLAVPEMLENERLSSADHLALLDALAGDARPVAFDEWSHGLGQDESLIALMLEWGLGPSLLVAALAFGLLLWRGRTRVGPEEDDAVDDRSEAVDLVDSLAQLYDRALSRREAAALQIQGFRQAVSLRTGLRGPALETRTRELLDETALLPAGERELTPSAFRDALDAVNDAYRRLDEHAHSRRRA